MRAFGVVGGARAAVRRAGGGVEGRRAALQRQRFVVLQRRTRTRAVTP